MTARAFAVLRSQQKTAEAISISVVLLLVSIVLFWNEQAFVVAEVLWGVGLIGLATTSIIAAPAKRQQHAESRRNLRPYLDLVLIVSLILVASLIRFVKLGSVPTWVHGDEAQHGLIARDILDGKITSLFATGWNGFPFLSFTPYALSMRLFGENLLGLRVASAVLGVAAVPALYLMTRGYLSIPAAYAAALYLAVSHVQVHFSRVGLNNITAPLLAILAFGFFVRGWESGAKSWYLLAGIFVSLGILTYPGSLIVPITIAIVSLLRLKQLIRGKLPGYGVMLFAAFISLAPLLISNQKNPATAFARTKGVWVFNNADHLRATYRTSDPVSIGWSQITHSYGALFGRGDATEMYHYSGGFADPITALFAVIGIAVMVWRWRDIRSNVCLTWLVAGLFFGATLTIDPPSYTRLLVIGPALAVAAASGLDWSRKTLHRFLPGTWPGVPSASWALVLAAVATLNLFVYFKIYPKRDQPPTLVPEIARYLDRTNDRYYVYFGGSPAIFFDYPTFRFLAPQTQGEDYAQVPSRLKSVPGLDAAFVIFPHRDGDLKLLRERFPGGKETREMIDPRNGYWTVFVVDSEAAPSEGSP